MSAEIEFVVEIGNLTESPATPTYSTYTATDSKFLSPAADRILSISGIKETFDARPTEVTVEISGLNKTTQITELFDENTDSRYQRSLTVKRKLNDVETELFSGVITRTSLTRSSTLSTIAISASNYLSFADNIVYSVRASDFGYSASPDIVYWGYLEIQES
tara:strand:- start:1490 stop:1975 length:486 start_codon:yes stop_codon:yes gene_type:complete